jgi:hypothetical protein
LFHLGKEIGKLRHNVKYKLYASILTILVTLAATPSILALLVTILPNNHEQSMESISLHPSDISCKSYDDEEIADFTLRVGETEISFFIKNSNRHMLVTYNLHELTSTLEFLVTHTKDMFYTVILVNRVVMSTKMCKLNILAPIEIDTSKSRFSLATRGGSSQITAQYTYRWWDAVWQVTGPSHLIKYHHPDRTFYEIATWNDWSKEGSKTTHNQINEDTSRLLAIGGWAAIFAFIGNYVGGPYAAFVAAILGAAFGYYTHATLADEEDCIWWWWGIDYNDWLIENLWWLVASGPVGLGAAIGALFAMGYLRVGDWTLLDACNAGNP